MNLEQTAILIEWSHCKGYTLHNAGHWEDKHGNVVAKDTTTLLDQFMASMSTGAFDQRKPKEPVKIRDWNPRNLGKKRMDLYPSMFYRAVNRKETRCLCCGSYIKAAGQKWMKDRYDICLPCMEEWPTGQKMEKNPRYKAKKP